jgi:hypothetical protein
MSLETGDLTTPALALAWSGGSGNPSPQYSTFVSSMSRSILNAINRVRLFSQTFVRTIDGTGTFQLQLPDFPVTSVTSLQVGNRLIPQSNLATPPNFDTVSANPGYGFRFISWKGELPGGPAMLEFEGGYFPYGVQNIKATYVAGYLISDEPAVVPSPGGNVTVQQPQGIWCLDGGVVYAESGAPLVPVSSSPTTGQYVPPTDATIGQYTFAAGDGGVAMLISYSYVPADLTEACNQMVAERLAYTGRIGQISKSLGGQESVRFMRGGTGRGMMPNLPPEVVALVMPYYNVIPPGDMGAPV